MATQRLGLGRGTVALLLLCCAWTGWMAPGCAKTTCEETATCRDSADGGIDATGSLGSGSGSGSSGSGSSGSGGSGSGGFGSGGSGSGSSSGSDSGSSGSISDGGLGPSSDGGSLDSCTGTGTEDCTNGIDDNCNGLIDCADPECQAGFECVAAAPEGWSGPGIVVESSATSDASSLASCPTAFATEAVAGTSDPTANGATCACACTNPTNAACGLNASFFYDSACANLCSSVVPTSACVAACSGAQTMTVTATLTQSGTCAPRPSTNVPTATWGSAARVCRASGPSDAPGGCATGMACVAKPPAPFASASCIWQSGSVACPNSSASRSVYFAGSADTRGCSACTCGAPQGATCGGADVTTFSDSACMTGASVIAGGGTCVSAPAGAHGIEESTAPSPSGGSCTPSAIASTGAFSPTSPTTVCCTP